MVAPWVGPFLEALRRTGVVAQAARAAGASYTAVYALRNSDADFAAAWDDALEESYDALEAELLDRAVNGVPEPLTYQGLITYEVQRDENGDVVTESYDTQTTDKDGKPIFGRRNKLLLDEQGRPVPVVVRKKSDALLMFALKGRRKRVYAERSEISGPDGKPVQIDEGARAARIAQIMAIGQARRDRERALEQEFGDLA